MSKGSFDMSLMSVEYKSRAGRLRRAGFSAADAKRIADLAHSIIAGLTPLTQVLAAAAETCRACGLEKTHRRLTDAMECLAAEVIRQTGVESAGRGGSRGAADGCKSQRGRQRNAH
jgi:hypothetical protein